MTSVLSTHKRRLCDGLEGERGEVSVAQNAYVCLCCAGFRQEKTFTGVEIELVEAVYLTSSSLTACMHHSCTSLFGLFGHALCLFLFVL